MKIVFYHKETHVAQEWASQLQQEGLCFEALFWPERSAGSVTADYAVVWNPPADLFSFTSGLKAVFNMGAGVDALLRSAALPESIPVVRLDDPEMAQKMAEYVLHAVTEFSRNLNQYRVLQQQKAWKPGAKDTPYDEWPIGVMGLGRIGQRIASTLAFIGYPVHGWSRSPKNLQDIHCFDGADQLQAFLNKTRILVNVLPLTPVTHQILNQETLQKLPQGAYIINIGRGQHVDEPALLNLLNNDHLAGAVLDVFCTEPLPSSHPFWDHPKVWMTPHISGPTHAGRALRQIAQDIHAHQNGQRLQNLVNRAMGY